MFIQSDSSLILAERSVGSRRTWSPIFFISFLKKKKKKLRSHKMSCVYLILLTCIGFCSGFKLLVVFPVPGKSHAILGEGYVRSLLEAGHEVTYVTPIPIKDSLKSLRQIDVSECTKRLQLTDVFNLHKIMYKMLDFQSQEMISDMMMDVARLTLLSEPVQKLINDPNQMFDAVINEWLYNEIGAGFAAVFNCPLIWSSSMVPHSSVLALIDEHLNPSYNIQHLSRSSSLTMLDRARNIWNVLWIHYYKWQVKTKELHLFEEVFGKAFNVRGRELPDFDDVRYNASMVLGNSNVCIGENIALPQNYKNIGGYHVTDNVTPLTEELKKIMDDAKDGVIYFSLGTILQSNRMPDTLKREIVQMFGKLKQTVIWKVDEDIPNLPKNIRLFSWAPQQSILAHPNTVLFITHGGLLSITEAIHYGLPLIVMPFFGDQYMNADRVAARGIGKRLELSDDSPRTLKQAIDDILIYNTSYIIRAKELSSIYHTRMTPPSKELVFWVEYVIKTGGAKHLRSVALHTEWYKKVHLDIFLTIALISVIGLYGLKHSSKRNKLKKKFE